MNKRYLLLIIGAFVISVISLSFSLRPFFINRNSNNQIRIYEGQTTKCTVDSKSYWFSLTFFNAYASRLQIKVDTGSGYQVKTCYVGKAFTVYDLKVTVTESFSNYVVIKVEIIS